MGKKATWISDGVNSYTLTVWEGPRRDHTKVFKGSRAYRCLATQYLEGLGYTVVRWAGSEDKSHTKLKECDQ